MKERGKKKIAFGLGLLARHKVSKQVTSEKNDDNATKTIFKRVVIPEA